MPLVIIIILIALGGLVYKSITETSSSEDGGLFPDVGNRGMKERNEAFEERDEFLDMPPPEFLLPIPFPARAEPEIPSYEFASSSNSDSDTGGSSPESQAFSPDSPGISPGEGISSITFNGQPLRGPGAGKVVILPVEPPLKGTKK